MHSKATTCLFFAILFGVLRPAMAKELAVDFEYQPPQWRTAICLPDDPYKTLVDEKGTLLYHYGRAGGDFGTKVSVVVDDGAKTVGQSLISPRVPIVRTERETAALQIVEEVFALKKPGPRLSQPGFSAGRKDRGRMERNWAQPPAGVTEKLGDVAVSFQQPVHYQIGVPADAAVTVALGICEGWHDEAGRRILDLNVEGAAPRQALRDAERANPPEPPRPDDGQKPAGADKAIESPKRLADALMDAPPKEFSIILSKLKPHSDPVLPILIAELDLKFPADVPWSDERREKRAKRQANAAIALLRLDRVASLLYNRCAVGQ
jgi:hypothetical protein